MERVSGLAAVEAELGRCRGRRGAAVLERWGRACGLLGRAEL
jgi:hypothetical protein